MKNKPTINREARLDYFLNRAYLALTASAEIAGSDVAAVEAVIYCSAQYIAKEMMRRLPASDGRDFDYANYVEAEIRAYPGLFTPHGMTPCFQYGKVCRDALRKMREQIKKGEETK